MRVLLIIIALTGLTASSAFSQKIDYDPPKGYEDVLTDAQYKKLVDISVKTVKKRYEVKSVKDGAIILDDKQELTMFNLHNLLLYMSGIDESDYEAAVKEHFQNIFDSIDFQNNMDPYDYDFMKDYLGIRIYEQTYIEEHGGMENVIYRTDLEGTYSVLVLDMPGAFSPVHPELFEVWEVSQDEVFAVGQLNVNKQECVKSSVPIEVDSTEIQVYFIENEDYAGSYALDMANNTPEFVGEWGSVMAIPNKGVVTLCKVSPHEPLDFMLFIRHFKSTTEQLYLEHPQPISPEFFWYYEGVFTRIGIVETEEAINVIPPFGLTDLMSTQK